MREKWVKNSLRNISLLFVEAGARIPPKISIFELKKTMVLVISEPSF